MKKISSFLIILLALCSCVENTNRTNQKFPNVQQDNFDNMLAHNKEKSYSLGNKILEKEFNDSVKLAIGKYMDSVKLFVNWRARIQRINSQETGKSVVLSFELQYAPEKYREVTFEVDYILPKDSLNSDKIYKTIKNINDYSTVYFDGFIRTKANGEAHYSSLHSDDLMHSYPVFKFFIIDINTNSKGDTLSNDLKRTVDLSFKAIELQELNYKKEISKKELSKRVDMIAPELKAAKEVLTNEERSYIDRLTQALTFNFIYAQE